MKLQLTNYRFRLWICTLIIISKYANAQWNTIYTSTVASLSYPYQLSYTADSAIFIASKKDFLFSKNNGLSFIGTNSFVTTPTVNTYNTYKEFADISFANKDTGAIAGASDAGIYYPFVQNATGTFTSWTLNHPITPTAALAKINSVKHFKNQKVFAFDNVTNLYYSSDGGISWALKNSINTASPIFGFGMCMLDEQQGYFATRQGIYKTTDGGQTFSYLPGFPLAYLSNIKKIRFRDISNGYIIAANNLGENKLFKTTDGGNSWQDVFQGKLPDPLTDVSFPTNDTGFVATSSSILQTFNGGATWYIQRYTNTYFYEFEFIDKNNGVTVALTGSNSLKVMKYVPNSIPSNPFALFNFQTNYCCNGQLCNITNYGSPLWTYKWYVNNVLSSTAFTPSGLILPNTGNNSVKLVAYNGANKDSVTLSIYNAGVFSGTSNFNITPYDSTICLGSQANLQIGNYSPQLSYSALSNSVQISPWASQSSGNLTLNTSPLNFNDTIITVMAVSGYSNCPGNSFSKTKKIKVLPLPPANLMSLVSDSICSEDSVRMIISPCTSGTTYNIKMGGTVFLNTFTATTGSSYYYGRDGLVYSQNFNYSATDINGCSITSPLLHVKIDTMWIKLRTIVPAVLPGDTIIIDNHQSVATNFNWAFSPGTIVVSNNDTIVKLKYASVGDYYLNLRARNNTGCRDSVNYNISVYNALNQGTGSTVCFSDTTLLDNLKQQPPYSWFIQSNGYHRFHTDNRENYYLVHNKYLSSNGWGTSLNYGSMHFRLMKYDKTGNLKWTLTPNFANTSIGPGFNYVHSTISTISSDFNGYVYITGNFRGNKLTIGNISRTFTTTSNSGYSNAFVAKIDSMGDCKWILAMNKSNGSYFHPVSVGKLVTDQENSTYMKVDFVGTAVFTNTVVNIGGYNSCLFVIDAFGNLKRTKLIYQTDDGQGSISTADASSSSVSYADYFSYTDKILKYKNKLIFYGYTNNSNIQFTNGPLLSAQSVPGYIQPALMSYVIITDTMGNLLNYFKPAVLYDSLRLGTSSNYSYNKNYEPNLSVDKNGNIFFQWNIGFDYYYNWSQYNNVGFNMGIYNSYKSMIKLNDNTEIKKTDLFSLIVKYDLNGNVLWHNETDYVYTKSMVANNDGNIYGLASFDKLATFNSANGNNQMITTPDTCDHMLLYSYDNSGNLLWGKPFIQGGNGVQYPGELAIKDSCNNSIYFSAGFDTTVTFAGNSCPKVTKTYIFKFSPDGNCNEINCIPTSTLVTGINSNITNTTNLFQVAPNPNKGQFSIHSNSKEELFIQVYNSTGQLIAEVNVLPDSPDVLLDIANSGVYYVMAKGKTVKGGQKILVIK